MTMYNHHEAVAMKNYRRLIRAIFFVGVTLFFSEVAMAQNNCKSLKVEVIPSSTTNGGKNGSVEVIVQGGNKPFEYVFLMKPFSGRKYDLVSMDLTKSKHSNLGKGKFFCDITDRKRCHKRVEFEIK